MLQAMGIVMVGAAAGGAFRYLITRFPSELTHHQGFPWGTLAVNVAGSFLVGFILTWSADHAHDRWRLLMATGFCGGLTTFSAYSFESMAYWRDGRLLLLGVNMLLNNVLSFAALLVGVWVHQRTG